LPRGSVVWLFDRTDICRAKDILGDKACIAGNIPSSLMYTGSPESVKAYCRKLIEHCGKGGGYIMSGGASVDKADPRNFHVLMEAAKEYGTYRK
jgi:uroporphyrinogen-III decarboxylase